MQASSHHHRPEPAFPDCPGSLGHYIVRTLTPSDPSIATTINERFVPVRVDADERPDVSERYSLGGWPTTAFLTPDGAIAGGGTFVPADRMGSVLEQVASAFEAQHRA